MRPSSGNVRARQDIAQTFPEYSLMANLLKMVSLQVLPLFEVREAFGTYPKIAIKQLMKRVAAAAGTAQGYAGARAPRSTYTREDLEFTQAAYSTEEHGFEGVVDENEAAVYDSHFQHEATTALFRYHQLMTERELRTSAAVFSTTTFTPGVSGQSQDAGTYKRDGTLGSAVKWSDWANAKPIDDIFHARTKVFQRIGCYPDTLLINETTWRDLRMCAQIIDKWQAVGAGGRAHQRALGSMNYDLAANNSLPGMSAIAEVLDVDEIIVASAVLDANAAGNAAFQASHIFGNSALLFKKVQGRGPASLREIGLGHTIEFNKDRGRSNTVMKGNHGIAIPGGHVIESYYEDQSRSEIIRCRHQDRQLLKYVAAGELITATY